MDSSSSPSSCKTCSSSCHQPRCVCVFARARVCLAITLQLEHLCALLYKQWDAWLCIVLLWVYMSFLVFRLPDFQVQIGHFIGTQTSGKTERKRLKQKRCLKITSAPRTVSALQQLEQCDVCTPDWLKCGSVCGGFAMYSSIQGQACLASVQPICLLHYLHSSEWLTHSGALAWNNIVFIVE